MKHLAKIQSEFIKAASLKQAGYMGLRSWIDSDTAADFVMDLNKKVKKGKDINKLVSKELNTERSPYNTSGVVNLALALEAESDEPDIDGEVEVRQFSHLLNRRNLKAIRQGLLKEILDAKDPEKWDSEENRKMHLKAFKRMLKNVKSKLLRKRTLHNIRRGPKGGMFFEEKGKKTYIK